MKHYKHMDKKMKSAGKLSVKGAMGKSMKASELSCDSCYGKSNVKPPRTVKGY